MSSAAVVESPTMLTVRQVAAMLGCSARHVYRLSDRGVMPRPSKLGDVLVRWSRAEIESWIASGCKPVRTPSSKGGRNHG